jgi:hypothetical protein
LYIRAYSQLGKIGLEKFQKFIANSQGQEYEAFRQRVERCQYHLLVIAPDNLEGVGSDQLFPFELVAELHDAWRSVRLISASSTDFQNTWERILRIAEPQLENSCMRGIFDVDFRMVSGLLRFHDQNLKNHFILLLKENEEQGLSTYYINLLSNVYQLEQGRLPIHAAGVIRFGKLFLFSGPSGAGKSTISMLSRAWGCPVLDEDQVLVRFLGNCNLTADGWGYNVASCDIPIKAVFFLRQADSDELVPLPKIQTAHLLFERYNDVMSMAFTNQLTQHAFNIVANIARTVPGYELHFRKSPDFWKVIDAELGL